MTQTLLRQQPLPDDLPLVEERAPVADLSRRERLAIILALTLAGLLRLLTVFHYRIDSDEPQHLHVVWGWTRGMLPYRDLFDNHMPLFQLLCAPFLWLIGERPEALIIMRLAMLPIYAAAVWLTYVIAATYLPTRVAAWSAVITALTPGFFLTSAEFRPDTLWAVFWLAAIAVLVSGPFTARRALAAGLLLGLAVAVSMKTILLLLALGAGMIVATATSSLHRRYWRRLGLGVTPLVVGILGAPTIVIALAFVTRGMWQPFLYATMGHNIWWRWRFERVLVYPLFLLLIGLTVRRLIHDETWPPLAARRVFIFVTGSVLASTLFCLWPIVEREHWLPVYPLVVISTAAWIIRKRLLIPALLLAITLIVGIGGLWRDGTAADLRVMRDALRLTTAGESVMDLKGETVFRRRAFYYVLETLTKQRLRAGLLRDTIADEVIRQHAMVVTRDDPGFPPAARAFLRQNYVDVGALRVAGSLLPANTNTFMIRLADRYAIVGGERPFRGLLDGQPYQGPRYLTAGLHTIEGTGSGDRLAFVWERAIARGLSPFAGNVGGP